MKLADNAATEIQRADESLLWILRRELTATYALVRRDLSASLIPGLAMTLSALIASGSMVPSCA